MQYEIELMYTFLIHMYNIFFYQMIIVEIW